MIAADVAVMDYARRIGQEVHLSTQLNISNAEALKMCIRDRHRNGAVHQIDGSGAFFCLFVNDSSFFQFADRKCIVEVFGIFRVNSESGNFAEVLTFGNLFG